MDLADRPDRPGLEPFARQPKPFARVAVVAHLRDQARLAGDARHDAGLLDRVGHRLLDIDVLPGAEGRHRDRGVHVVGRGDHHRVDVLPLVQEHPIVAELLGLREGLEGARRLVRVDVAQGDDVLGGHVADHAAALAADADPGDVQLLAGRRESPARGRGAARRGMRRSSRRRSARIRGGS